MFRTSGGGGSCAEGSESWNSRWMAEGKLGEMKDMLKQLIIS